MQYNYLGYLFLRQCLYILLDYLDNGEVREANASLSAGCF